MMERPGVELKQLGDLEDLGYWDIGLQDGY
jgi:hypothetical protein